MSRVFAHGGLRLYLLLLLEDESRHGYELIRQLEDRFMGMYTPSAGTIYPRLSALEADGLLSHKIVDGKKVYSLTAAGRAELEARREELADIATEAVHSAGAIAREIRDEVRSSVRDLRRELKESVRDVRREERRASRDSDGLVGEQADASREVARQTREVVRAERVARRESGQELRDVLRSLRSDLESFVTDVVVAAQRHRLDAERLRLVSDALLVARESVIEALDGRPVKTRENE